MDRQALIDFLEQVRTTASNNAALLCVDLYPEWKAGIEITQEMLDNGENRFQYTSNEITKLYLCKQPHTTQEDWTPDITPALFDVIDVEHAGTKEDPIPYDPNMIVYKDKYYVRNEVIYLCIRDSGNPLYAEPDAFINNYFVVA